VFIVASVMVTAALFSPLRKWQKKPSQRVKVKTVITGNAPGVVSWSGSDWQAELADGEQDDIPANTNARVVQVEGIRLIVAKE